MTYLISGNGTCM